MENALFEINFQVWEIKWYFEESFYSTDKGLNMTKPTQLTLRTKTTSFRVHSIHAKFC